MIGMNGDVVRKIEEDRICELLSLITDPECKLSLQLTAYSGHLAY